GVHIHLYRIFTDYDDVLEGKMLVSSSSDEEGRSGGDVPFGAISGFMTRNQPGAIKRFYVLPYEISKVKRVESKYYLSLLHGLTDDVRLLIAPNPSSLLLVGEKMSSWAEQLIHDVRVGAGNPDFLPDDARSGLP